MVNKLLEQSTNHSSHFNDVQIQQRAWIDAFP
jgi:hypothetical protein